MKRRVAAFLAALVLLGATAGFVQADAQPPQCSTAWPRVILYSADAGTGHSVVLCTDISDLDLIQHVYSGDCPRVQFDPFGNDWNNCANSIRLYLRGSPEDCFRAYNGPNYQVIMGTWDGPKNGVITDIQNDVLSSLRFGSVNGSGVCIV